MFFTNLVFSMSSLRGRFVATIFVIRFFPQKLFGKIDWKNCLEIWLENLLENWMENLLEKMCWKICWKNVLENLLEKYVRNLAGNVGWKCWLNIWLEKMLVNGCEIIGGKIVATNLPLRLSTTYIYIPRTQINSCFDWKFGVVLGGPPTFKISDIIETHPFFAKIFGRKISVTSGLWGGGEPSGDSW